MEVEIIKLLKIFIEKHLIPTIGAIVLGFIAYLKTPEDTNFIEKFGNKGYSIFLFCICFLSIEFIIWIFNKIKSLYECIKNDTYYNRRIKRENREELEKLWTLVDRMSYKDYKLLMEFIKNGNKPHFEAGICLGEGLLNSQWVYKSEVQADKKIPAKVYNVNRMNEEQTNEFITLSARYQYILKDEIFQILKYSLETYGKISHFQR